MNKESKTYSAGKWLYITLAAAALVIVTVAVILAVSGGGNETLEDISGGTRSSVYDSASASLPDTSVDVTPSASQIVPQEQAGGDQEPQQEQEQGQPTVKEINFILPVKSGVCTKEFTEVGVVFNKTLGIYTGHMGMDITADEGAEVLAVFAGRVSSIETSYLTGTTVVIDHGNGLKTVYNSIEVNENLSVGDELDQGDVIGVVSTNNRQEYKDGAHLHFEVEENGTRVSPAKYFAGYDK